MALTSEKITTAKVSKANGSFFSQKEKPKSFFFQPKLTIGPVDDVYEREADAVADKVMRMSDTEQVKTKSSAINIRRKCAACEEEEHLQRKEKQGGEIAADSSFENYVGSLGSGGQPLPKEARTFYEPRFGYDFSNVKIHTDAVAAKSAQSINALAYTSGNNIVFNNGKYSPSTNSGKKLLSHELTHVVQQSVASETSIRRKKDSCDNMTQVIVDMISFRGSTRNPYSDLAEANRIYRPCCVEFVPGQGLSVMPSFSDPLMGNDTTFERADCDVDSPEEQALIPAVTSAFNLRGRIRAFYFKRINPDARATSHPQYCSTALTLNHVYMTNSAVDRTLAHEMGHIFLNGFFHELPPDNLMHPSYSATDSNLTDEQCATIRGNI